jgi:hypothetical protein
MLSPKTQHSHRHSQAAPHPHKRTQIQCTRQRDTCRVANLDMAPMAQPGGEQVLQRLGLVCQGTVGALPGQTGSGYSQEAQEAEKRVVVVVGGGQTTAAKESQERKTKSCTPSRGAWLGGCRAALAANCAGRRGTGSAHTAGRGPSTTKRAGSLPPKLFQRHAWPATSQIIRWASK